MWRTLLVLSLVVATQCLSTPWIHHRVDYSAANEYINAHYDEMESSPYFAESKPVVAVYDARNQTTCLEADGFCVRNLESDGKEEDVSDWTDREQVSATYLPKLRRLLEIEYGGDLLHVVFWHSMLREEEEMEISQAEPDKTPTSSVASLVHIDNDIGAYTSEQLMSLIEKNRLERSDAMERIRDLVASRHRFAIINSWRNVQDEPVQSAPLALFRPVYRNEHDCFPTARPDPKQSKWFTYPEMTKDEVLLFKQYDRRLDRRSDIWHCALKEAKGSAVVSSRRKSFDVRTFCVFSSKVNDDLDRFGASRMRSLLSLGESECFCREQGRQRRQSGLDGQTGLPVVDQIQRQV